MDLKGKVIFITGAAQGLGKAYVNTFLEKGAKVFISDLNPTAGQETLQEYSDRFGSANVQFAPLDVTNHAQFEEVFQRAVSHFGQVDVMINNAGIMNEGAWQAMVQINLVSLVVGTKLATAHMRKDQGGKGGRIINISSVAGLSDVFAVPIYCATKHGVRTYTCSLARQPKLDEQGIEYGILCPEAAATDLILKVDDQKIDYYSMLADRLKEEEIMPISRVVDAMMKLIQLEKMNGAIMYVSKERIQQREMQAIDIGPTL